MDLNYSIDEILKAVDEINNKKKNKEEDLIKNKSSQKNHSSVPKNTLKLIEEAEQNIN